MKQNRWVWVTAKYAAYAAVVVLSYVLGSSPDLPAARPIFVMPAVVALALYEGEFIGGLYGALAGVLLDYGATSLFGIQAMLMLLLGCTAGLISIYFFQNTYKSMLILTACMAAVVCGLRYFLLYGMWGLPGATALLVSDWLPIVLLTAAVSPVFRLIVGAIFNYFEPYCRPVGEMS